MTFSEMLGAAFPTGIWVVLAVCAVLSAVGFYKFVYFLSVGYGFAVCGAGAAMLVMYGAAMDIWGVLLCVLFMVYGVRLGGFLLWREVKSASYRKTLSAATGDGKPMPVFVKAAIWVCVAVMYTMQVSPVFYRVQAGAQGGAAAPVGAAVMAVALVIESLADKQKSAAKQKAPGRFCDSGLYKLVRCPNYFGELLFWTGVLISGFGALRGAVQWAVALIGYILIVYVMFSGAKRLELRQNKSYGQDAVSYTHLMEEEIKDRFAVELAFGTAGLRGVLGAGTNRMNVYMVRKATQGLANYLLRTPGEKSVAISYDSRIKSDVFAREAACVLAANGVKAWLYKELMPVPALSFATRFLQMCIRDRCCKRHQCGGGRRNQRECAEGCKSYSCLRCYADGAG